MNYQTFFSEFLIIAMIVIGYGYADIPSVSGPSASNQYISDSGVYLHGDGKQSYNQSDRRIWPDQLGRTPDHNDSSMSHPTSKTPINHLTGEQNPPTTTPGGTDSPASRVTPAPIHPNTSPSGPGSGSQIPILTPVVTKSPTPLVSPTVEHPNETHFGPGSGSQIPISTPVVTKSPTPLVSPTVGRPNETHFGPGSGSQIPVSTPVVTVSPVPQTSPPISRPNGSYPVSGPGQYTPIGTQPVPPVITPIPGYPDNRYPSPTYSPPETPVMTPPPGQHDVEPTQKPDNGPDPIMSDILLHRGDPTYYNGRYSYPDDPAHYRYESSPHNAPRYDRDSGALQVLSTPPGATVYLNNNYEGKTPSTGYLGISSLTPGSYQITISSVGYYDYTSIITVYRNEIETVNAVLVPASSDSTSNSDVGTLDVQSTPSGAGVLLNNVYRGSCPLTLQSISPGEYNLTVIMDGYSWYARDISITSGQTTAVSAVLIPLEVIQTDQESVSTEETVLPSATKSPLPAWILFLGLIMGGLCAMRRV